MPCYDSDDESDTTDIPEDPFAPPEGSEGDSEDDVAAPAQFIITMDHIQDAADSGDPGALFSEPNSVFPLPVNRTLFTDGTKVELSTHLDYVLALSASIFLLHVTFT